MSSKSPLQCAGNIVMAVFGEETLLRSTITGRDSGRTKAQLMKNKGDNQETDLSFQPLDPTKLSACEDFFTKWVKERYSPMMMAKDKEWKIEAGINEAKEMSLFRNYVTKKISYLKRPAPIEKKKKRTENEKSGDTEGEDSTGTSKRKRSVIKGKKRYRKRAKKNDLRDISDNDESQNEETSKITSESKRPCVEEESEEIEDDTDENLSEISDIDFVPYYNEETQEQYDRVSSESNMIAIEIDPLLIDEQNEQLDNVEDKSNDGEEQPRDSDSDGSM